MPHDGDRVALIILRAWVEPGSDEGALRIRVTAIEDLSDRQSARLSIVGDEVRAACAIVEDVLTRFQRGEKRDGGVTTVVFGSRMLGRDLRS